MEEKENFFYGCHVAVGDRLYRVLSRGVDRQFPQCRDLSAT